MIQVVYKRLSHKHRKELHGHIADWLLERQQQSANSVRQGRRFKKKRTIACARGEKYPTPDVKEPGSVVVAPLEANGSRTQMGNLLDR